MDDLNTRCGTPYISLGTVVDSSGDTASTSVSDGISLSSSSDYATQTMAFDITSYYADMDTYTIPASVYINGFSDYS